MAECKRGKINEIEIDPKYPLIHIEYNCKGFHSEIGTDGIENNRIHCNGTITHTYEAQNEDQHSKLKDLNITKKHIEICPKEFIDIQKEENKKYKYYFESSNELHPLKRR